MTAGFIWSLRIAAGRTPVAAFVAAWANGIRAGRRNSEVSA